MFTDIVRIRCPYCGEQIELVIDLSVELQAYIEDCSVCCRPVELTVSVTGTEASVTARRDDE